MPRLRRARHKILAIRGNNLASLKGEFEVDFRAEPLASRRPLRHHRPHRRRQSTLLDALCLALFERTPRLARVTGRGEIPDVGEHSTHVADPRTCCQPRCAEGFCRGGLRRPRRRRLARPLDGAPGPQQAGRQAAEHRAQLTCLADGQLVGGHTKRETLQAIEESIGLSFEQFTRAVLLAQNDFATFLKASDDERAELLQTLTGTQTYSQLLAARLPAHEGRAGRPWPPPAAARRPGAAGCRRAGGLRGRGRPPGCRPDHARRRKAGLDARRVWFRPSGHPAAGRRRGRAQGRRGPRRDDAARAGRTALVEAAQPARQLLARLDGPAPNCPRADERCRASAAAVPTPTPSPSVPHSSTWPPASWPLPMPGAAKPSPGSTRPRPSTRALPPWPSPRRRPPGRAGRRSPAGRCRHPPAPDPQRAGRLQRDLAEARDWLHAHPQLQPLAEAWPRWDAAFAQAGRLAGQLDAATAQRARQAATLAGLDTQLRTPASPPAARSRRTAGRPALAT